MMTRTEAADRGTEATSREEAFRSLADEHMDGAYRLARVILGNAADAEDATHDAFVAAWRHWSSLREPAQFTRWFDRILVNTCRNRLRRTARWRSEDLSADLWPAPDELGQIHDRDLVGAAIAALSAEHRIVIALRFYRDLTVEEIASRIGARPGTVKSRLHYALKRLQADLRTAAGEGMSHE
jgi:RNA polymerase sigma-70 factor (ECF subfamily)